MENQVLSTVQMQELIELGIDTSKASMCYDTTFIKERQLIVPEWCHKDKKTGNIANFDFLIPAFTLQDILILLEPCHRLMVIKHEPDKWLDYAFNLLKFQYRNN